MCQKPVIKEPRVLPDGRLVHAECDERPRTGASAESGKQLPSGSRVKVARPKAKTG